MRDQSGKMHAGDVAGRPYRADADSCELETRGAAPPNTYGRKIGSMTPVSEDRTTRTTWTTMAIPNTLTETVG